ncbi:hypothetical protein Y032_0016g3044 [Ancylostoma ceylanicum]|uniref:Uncharacterized protein n=1 Tax=Ancylostoma ceylanicum TaxID=53326 RepID=A0A016V5M3_9BILA|nr:hypothetical protein Y032_0016g3044 [Ancylostoma ceylanicum]
MIAGLSACADKGVRPLRSEITVPCGDRVPTACWSSESRVIQPDRTQSPVQMQTIEAVPAARTVMKACRRVCLIRCHRHGLRR